MEDLLRNEYKVYLDKVCRQETLRHVFYQTIDDYGHHFYHIRYSATKMSQVPKIKDYNVIDVEDDDVKITETINKIISDIKANYLEYNGYSVACNRKEAV